MPDDDLPDNLGSWEQHDAERRARLAVSIPFDVAHMPKIEHGRLNRPLAIGEGFAIQTNGGDALRLDDLFQYRTYAGVLNGTPFEPFSELESAVNYVASVFPGHEAPPRALPPTMHAGTRRGRGHDGAEYDEPWCILPSCTTIARFTASRPARGTDEPYSSVVLIWYQDKFGLPDDPHILTMIAELDWELYAHHWSW